MAIAIGLCGAGRCCWRTLAAECNDDVDVELAFVEQFECIDDPSTYNTATMGFLAATVGGWVDQVLSRFVDVVISIPTLIFALIVLSSTGTSILALVTVIAIIYAMPVYRIARAVAMDIEVMDYVEAARLRGEGLWWIMRREILPNALTPLAAEFGLRFCFVFLLISGLSFLGLGLQPPLADWGAMVRDNGGGIAWGFMHPLVPATCIALLTIGINLIVDSAVQKASGLREDH